MKQIFSKIFVLLCITALVFSAPAAWETHDPTTGTYTQVAATSRDHPFQPKWFSTEAKSTTDVRFVYGYMTAPSTKTVSTLDLTSVTVSEYVVKAISQGLRCFILHKNTASGQQLNAYLYPATGGAAPTARLIASAGNATINPAAALSNDFSVNDDCTAFRYGALSFHWSGSAWVADTIAIAWTNPVFNNDHSIAVSDNAIHTYATNAYTKNALVDTFHTNKQVYTTSTKMVVFSWQAGTGADVANKVFNLHISSISGTTITTITEVSGTSYLNVPRFSISQNLQNIVLTYQSTATGNPYTFVGKVVNYLTNRAVDIQTHPFLKEGSPQIYVGNRYLYAIRTVNVNSMKQHQPFIINGDKLVLYNIPLNYGATTYTRVLLQSAPLNQLNVIYQRINTNVYTLQQQLLSSNLNIISFDINKQADGSTARALTAPVRQSVSGKTTWYVQGGITGSQKVFEYNAFIGGSLTRNSKKLADTYTTKAKSVGKTCLVLHDSAGTPKVQVWDLNTHNPSATKKDITSKVTMGSIATTEFQITDDCGALRIDGKFYHWDTNDYFEDNVLPASTVPVKPVFSKDGKYLIANNGIFTHTPKSGATPGNLTLQRNDTFYDNKQIFIDATSTQLVIWSWMTLGADSFVGKVQVNYKAGTGLMRVITQTGGPLFAQPRIAINDKFNRIVVWGATSATTFFYAGLFVDWSTKTFKPITLPQQITSRGNVITISDDYLYARNAVLDAATGYRKHYVYNIQGNTLFKMIDQFVYPSYITSDNTRTFVASDSDGKMLLAYQYFFSTEGIYRLVKDVRMKPTDVLLANKLPLFDLEFAYTTQTTPVTDFFASSTTPFGRYVWLDSASKLNYLQYSPQTVPSKKITVTAAAAIATGFVIKATSPSKDCLVLRKAGALKVFYVNLTASPATITQVADIQTTVVAGGFADDAAINTAIAADLKVSDRCQKVKIGAHIYYKSAAAAYTKNTKGSGLTTPVFDSNLNFANDATKVYRWNTTSNDYDQPITGLSGLKTTKQLFVNQNQNKILLFTQQANGSPYDLAAKLWTLNGNTWTEVQTIPPASTTTGAAIAFVSPDFETIGIIYEGAASALTAIFAKANYATASLTVIPTPTQWTTSAYQLSPLPTIILGNNYLYYRSNKAGTGNVRAQITYRIDKVANKFVQLKRRDLTPEDLTALTNNRVKNIVLNENNDLLTLVYQITPASPANTIQIIRRDMGSANVQTVVRGIAGNVVVVNNIVYPCPPGCKQCNDPQNCASCQASFVLETSGGISTGKCLKCRANGCAECADGVVSTCTTCLAGKYKDGGDLCVNCDSSCLTCSGGLTSNCLTCKIGFYLTGGNACSACPANCNVCTSPTACTPFNCKTGFVWDSTTSINGVIGNCVKCAAGCANCKADKIFQCTNSSVVAQSCGTDRGFEAIIVNNTNTGCKICPPYCKTCANGICSVCRDDYLLVDGKCVQKCVSPCQTCNAGFPSQCTSCIGGYIISGNSCNPDLGCNSAASCTACPIGYNLLSGICVKCQGGANCQVCLSTSSTTCISCVKGYYYDPSIPACAVCALGCATCNNDVTCLTCASGYYFAISSHPTIAASGKCLKCDDSCLSCYKDAYSCDICANGYRRNGFKCQGNNRVAFSTKFDVAITAVTNSIMVNIQKTYSNAVGLPQSSVTIISVVSGSVIVEGSITTASQSSVPTVAAALSSAITAGTTVDGLTVIGSSLTAVTTSGSYSVEDNSSYYKNVAIIVGIVIPIGIIIIFIIIIVLMKKGVICVDSGNGRVRDASMDEINVNQKQSEYNTMRKK